MALDAEEHLASVQRSVAVLERDGKAARAVRLSRCYSTTIEDLWDAITNGERIPRWFAPVSGDLELGGRYQVEGNAGGIVTACQPPKHYALTWEFGGDVSWVEMLISEDASGPLRLELTHTSLLSPHWDEYGPGATGVGWEMGFLGLALYLAAPNEPKLDEAAFATSPDGRALLKGSSEAWGNAAIASGEDADAARRAAARTAAFYTGES